MTDLTHFDDAGRARMVDVGGKAETERSATARGAVYCSAETIALIRGGGVKKGDVLSVARLAGIMGAKRTPALIPLCHPLALTSVAVHLPVDAGPAAVHLQPTCRLPGRPVVVMHTL